MSQSHLEVEAKFYIADLPALRERLLTAGAELIRPRIFEKNVIYDNAWNGLAAKMSLVRLRQDAKVTMTYKGVPADFDPAQSEVRVREELEIEISDFETAHLMLARLGFEPQHMYEKYREAFTFNGLEVVLDELPYGDFVEIEGNEGLIRVAADQLQLDWQQRINTNYLGLLDTLNQHYDTNIADLTFDNFNGTTFSMGEVLN